MVSYLAGCGLQSCPMLLAKGYPDIGWNPCGGERYLDFLRFAVFVNGEAGGGGNWAGGWGAVMGGQTSLGCGPYSRPQAWPGQGCLLVGTGQGPEVSGGLEFTLRCQVEGCPGTNPGQWLKRPPDSARHQVRA